MQLEAKMSTVVEMFLDALWCCSAFNKHTPCWPGINLAKDEESQMCWHLPAPRAEFCKVSNDNKNCNSDSLWMGEKVSEDCVAHVNLTCHTANASTCCSYKDNKLQISANCRVTTFCIAHSCASFNGEVTYSVAKKTKIQT